MTRARRLQCPACRGTTIEGDIKVNFALREALGDIDGGTTNVSKTKTIGFLDTPAPSGRTWQDEVNSQGPLALDSGSMYPVGAWGQCIAYATLYELTTPDWAAESEYRDEGVVGSVLLELSQKCKSNPDLQRRVVQAGERLERDCRRAHVRGQPLPIIHQQAGVTRAASTGSGFSRPSATVPTQHRQMSLASPAGFMGTASPAGCSWRQFCAPHFPEIDTRTGFVVGPWGECLAWAKVFELQNPGWEDGPCGQAINAMLDRAGPRKREIERAADLLEQACAAAGASRRPVPLINYTLQ